MTRTILIVDDEQNMRWVLERALQKAGYDILTAESGEQGLRLFARHPVDLVLLDLKMRGMDGLAALREIRQRSKNVPVLLLTAYATVPTAVEALRIGATDYLRKPFDLETLLAQINRYLAEQTNETYDKSPTRSDVSLGDFVGVAPALTDALNAAMVAAQTHYPVIIEGQPGTGRKHLGAAIHQNTPATENGRLVTVHCANLPHTILQRELLSQVDDGTTIRPWQQALGGTLLLADVAGLELAFVDSLVAHLSDYLLSPQHPHGLRLILTSDQTLHPSWGRLCQTSLSIQLPPLAQRKEDLPLLLETFAPGTSWAREAKAHLAAYDWPGNVAELRRIVRQAALLAGDGPIEMHHLPSHITAQRVDAPGAMVLPPDGVNLDKLEEDLIRQALVMARYNKSQAAKLLGISRATLLYRLDKYDITDEA